MIGVGIIGYGKMGKIRHEAIKADGRARVLGVVDPFFNNQVAEIKKHNKPYELLANPEIQAVFVCTPNYLNKDLTIAALKAGKHVFCEKPPAFTSSEVEEIISIEKLSSKKLMYGFNHRHHGSVIKAQEFIESGQYGRVLWMRGRYGKSVDKAFFEEWRAKKELVGGGIFLDQGIHMLDLFLMFSGGFDEVKAFVSSLYWKLEVEDNVFAIFKNNKTGVVASLHSTMTQWRHLFSLEIFLEKGYMVINGLLTSSGTYGEEVMTVAKNRSTAPAATWSDEEHFRFEINDSWESEIKQFLDCIENNTSISTGNSKSALDLMKLVDKVYQQKNT